MAGAYSSAYSSAYDTNGAPAAGPNLLTLLGVGGAGVIIFGCCFIFYG